MKIVEKEPKWEFKLVCMGCNSKLVVEEDDLFFAPTHGYPDGVFAYGFTCPVCKSRRMLADTKGIPERALKAAGLRADRDAALQARPK